MKQRLVPEDLFRFRLVGLPAISSNGTLAAFVEQQFVAAQNSAHTRVGLVRLQGGRVSGEVRYTAGPRDTAPALSPDGSLLAFVRRGAEGPAQLWLMRTDGGEAWRLTNLSSGASAPQFSPDGKSLAFLTRLGPDGLQEAGQKPAEDDFTRFTKNVKVITRLQYKFDGEGFLGDKRSHVAVVPVAEQPQPVSAVRLVSGGEYDHKQAAWSPDGRWVLVSAHRSAEADWHPRVMDIWALPVDGGEPLRLTDGSLGCYNPQASPDGRLVAFRGDRPEGNDYTDYRLYVVDGPAVDGRSSTPRCLTADFGTTWGNQTSTDLIGPGESPLTWSADGQRVYGVVSDAGTVQLASCEIATGTVGRHTGGDHVVYGAALAPRAGVAVLGIAHPLSPGDLYTLDLTDPGVLYKVMAGQREPGPVPSLGGLQPITAVNEALLAELDLSSSQRFFYRAEGGPPVDGWLVPPAGGIPAEGKVPVVLCIHGGPMAMYSATFSLEFQVLAAQGYAVVFTNPRGSRGYGDDFCRCIVGQWGDKDYADVMAGLDHALAQNPWIDPDRQYVTGGSYGGFMVNWIIGHTDRFKAALTSRSVVNRHSAMGSADEGWDRLKQYGPLWWEDPTPYWQQSPLRLASRMTTPLLIEHQEEDYRLPVDQAEQLYAALKFQRRTVKLVRYPGESHGMVRGGKPWHRVHRFKLMLEWFAEHV